MLLGIDPILVGRTLSALDEMGHGDMLVISDAHFTAAKLAKRPVIELPGLSSPRVLKAVRRLFVPDGYSEFQLGIMDSGDGQLLDVQKELIAAAGLENPRLDPVVAGRPQPHQVGDRDRVGIIERFAFYDLAAQAELIIRTGETRTFGNALFIKGVTPVEEDWN